MTAVAMIFLVALVFRVTAFYAPTSREGWIMAWHTSTSVAWLTGVVMAVNIIWEAL